MAEIELGHLFIKIGMIVGAVLGLLLGLGVLLVISTVLVAVVERQSDKEYHRSRLYIPPERSPKP